MVTDDDARFIIIRDEISAEMQAATLRGPGRNRVKKVRLQDAMFVVPEFGPRIRKKNEECGDASVGRQTL